MTNNAASSTHAILFADTLAGHTCRAVANGGKALERSSRAIHHAFIPLLTEPARKLGLSSKLARIQKIRTPAFEGA